MQCLKQARRAELLLAFVVSQVLETCELPRAGRAWDGAALGARAACSAVAVAVVPAVPSFAPETAVTGVAVVMTLAAIRWARCNNLWNWSVTKTGRAAVHRKSTSASKPTMARFAQHSTGLFMDRLQSLFPAFVPPKTHTHTYTHTHIHTHSHTHTHTRTHANTHTHIQTHTHTLTHTHTHTHACEHTHAHTNTHARTHTHTHTCTRTHTHTHTNTHTHEHTHTYTHTHAHAHLVS